ncbi:hypothetical protein [Brevundimonas sp.]|uniref:hypothetical protein n=1 Tax=Brevundimonas sp. TaxID=1871086 RepID=UPI002ED8FB44
MIEAEALKPVGFFAELEPGDDGRPHLAVCRGGMNWKTAEAVAAYLEKGAGVVDVMGVTIDPLDEGTAISGGPSLVSDGVWVWRVDLSYFVRKYGVSLPADFVMHALEDGPMPPQASIASRYEEALKAAGWSP